MKRVETFFICDDCGQPLPSEYVHRKSNGEEFFNNGLYNEVKFEFNIDCWIHVNVDLQVNVDYGGTYKDLCPKCRVKWLKKALSKFEEVAGYGKDD